MKRIYLLLILLLIAAVLAAPIAAQEATPTVEPVVTEVATVVVAPSDSGTVVVEQPSGTANVPDWLIANLTVFLIAAGMLWDIAKTALHQRNLKTALDSADEAHKAAIEAALQALPDTAKEAISRVLDMAETLTTQFESVLKFAKDVSEPAQIAITNSGETPPQDASPAG